MRNAIKICLNNNNNNINLRSYGSNLTLIN